MSLCTSLVYVHVDVHVDVQVYVQVYVHAYHSMLRSLVLRGTPCLLLDAERLEKPTLFILLHIRACVSVPVYGYIGMHVRG